MQIGDERAGLWLLVVGGRRRQESDTVANCGVWWLLSNVRGAIDNIWATLIVGFPHSRFKYSTHSSTTFGLSTIPHLYSLHTYPQSYHLVLLRVILFAICYSRKRRSQCSFCGLLTTPRRGTKAPNTHTNALPPFVDNPLRRAETWSCIPSLLPQLHRVFEQQRWRPQWPIRSAMGRLLNTSKV